MPRLSIIILSYNTKDITLKCLRSVYQSLNTDSEVIVVDNASTDGSKETLADFGHGRDNFRLIENKKNLGYPAGNNQAIKVAHGQYILLLNSDVIIKELNFDKVLNYLDENKNIGVLTVKVLLNNGQIDPASHRGFPTIWNSFCYFLKLEKLFSRVPFLNKVFCGYHLTWNNLNSIHEIDSPNGAFYLTRKDILDKIGGFDEHFFMYGEDLDLSYRIKRLGYKIVYYPHYQVTHLKYVSGLKKDDIVTKKTTKKYFFEAMKIFYQKHYASYSPTLLNKLIYFFIELKYRFS